MITTTYDRANHSLKIEGHSHYAEHGKDIVCAAVSILAYTLAEDINMAYQVGYLTEEPTIDMQEGNAEIKCCPIEAAESIVSLIFQNVCVGFEIMSKQYPEYVAYDIT